MSKINKVVVKGVSYDIEDAYAVRANDLNNLEKELLSRIQGTSQDSDATKDPFKFLGTFRFVTGGEFLNALNAMHGTVAGVYDGYWRALIGASPVEIYNFAIYYKDDRWIQVLKSPYKWGDGDFDIITDTRYRTIYRIHENGSWGEWRDTEEELEKAISDETKRAKDAEQANRQLIADLVGESPETLDTIHEISSWILNDETGAAAMAKEINENKNAIAGLGEKVDNSFSSILTSFNNDSVDLDFGNDNNPFLQTVSILDAQESRAGVMSANDYNYLHSLNSTKELSIEFVDNDEKIYLSQTEYPFIPKGVRIEIVSDAITTLRGYTGDSSKEFTIKNGYVTEDAIAILQNFEATGSVTIKYTGAIKELEEKVDKNTNTLNALTRTSMSFENTGIDVIDGKLALTKSSVNGEQVSQDIIPAATTESAGVLSAEDKETLDSLPIRLGDINVIELEQSQFSNLIWAETKFVPANNNYNSYILRIPEQTPLALNSVTARSYFAFKERPYDGYSPQDFIKITYWGDYPEGIPSGYRYLVIQLHLPNSPNYDAVVTFGEHGLGKRISTLSKKIDEGIVPMVDKMRAYEIEAIFAPGFILPKNGTLPITDNAAYVHVLMDCVEGQRFTVSARATQYVYAWQFLDDSNNILTKYEGAETPVVDTILIAPFGAKKLLVNGAIHINHSVKFWISNNPENVLSKEIKEVSDKIKEVKETVGTFDSRITNVEDKYNNIKGIVGEPSSSIDLTASDYSGLVYGGASFVKASSNYDSFIFPLTKGRTYKLINNTALRYEQAGILTIFTFSVAPALGEIGYVRKLYPSLLKSFTPQEGEKYLVVNIHKPSYTDNNFAYYSEAVGLLKRVEEMEDNFSKPLQGKTILCLGDSITEFKYQDKRYSDYLAEITGANVINGGIGGTQMGRRATISSTAVFSSNAEAYACLDLPSIARALNTGDFTKQEAAAQWLISDDNTNKTSDDNTAIIERLKGVDLNSVDIVTIFIGTNDIGGNLGEVGEKGDDTSVLNMSKGFYQIIKNLLTANPNLRIYYYSPIPRYFGDIRTFDPENADTDPEWCDAYETAKGYKFPEMVDHQIKLAEYFKIPACDMYRTMSINRWNIASIMRGDISDGTHPYKGFKMLANKIASFIIANNNLNI